MVVPGNCECFHSGLLLHANEVHLRFGKRRRRVAVARTRRSRCHTRSGFALLATVAVFRRIGDLRLRTVLAQRSDIWSFVVPFPRLGLICKVAARIPFVVSCPSRFDEAASYEVSAMWQGNNVEGQSTPSILFRAVQHRRPCEVGVRGL